jgi:DNA-binding XRE family transcriptional regulator
MSSKWQEIRDRKVGGNPAREARIATYKAMMNIEGALDELRRRRGVTQTDLAAELGMGQRNVSRIEHADDLRLSTLACYVAGLGGRLEVHAVFQEDDEDVTLAAASNGNGRGGRRGSRHRSET